jgi:hypothetical protein
MGFSSLLSEAVLGKFCPETSTVGVEIEPPKPKLLWADLGSCPDPPQRLGTGAGCYRAEQTSRATFARSQREATHGRSGPTLPLNQGEFLEENGTEQQTAGRCLSRQPDKKSIRHQRREIIWAIKYSLSAQSRKAESLTFLLRFIATSS